MTDREMLEFAAKAAGIESGGGLFWCPATGNAWNPIADDGDALRLMVSIGIRDYFGLEVQKHCVQATCFEPWEHCEYEEYKNQDPIAATRRAIVRAAAEIGRNMK